MKFKKLKFSAVLLLGLGLTGLQAQTMYVKENNDLQTGYTLTDVRKMTFSEGGLIIQKNDNSTGLYALSELRYLSFTDFTTSIIDQTMQLGSVNIITYPNPVIDVLNIDLTDLASDGTISILSLDGKLLQEQKTNGANTATLNLSQLPRGMYVCQYVSTTEIKTVKIIKQ